MPVNPLNVILVLYQNIRTYLRLLLVLMIITKSAYSQDKKYNHFVDSLLHRISESQEDSNKVKYYQSLGGSYYQTNPDSFLLYTRQGLALAQKIDWKKGIANCSNNIGLLLSDTGNHKLAITYLEESLRINREINSKLNIINNLTNIGRIYYREADFVTSSNYFFDALKIAEEINHHEKIAMIGTNLTATFCSQKDWEKGEKYALLTLQHSELANAPMHTFKSYIALGEIKGEQSDSLQAKQYFEKALKVANTNGFKLLSAEALNNMALMEKNNQSALIYALEARKIYDEQGPNSLNSMMNLETLSILYLRLFHAAIPGQERNAYLQKAENYLKEKADKCTKLKYAEALASGLYQLVNVMELKGNYQMAHLYNKQYHIISDSLYSQETKNKIATIEGHREVASRDAEIALNKLAISAQRKLNMTLALGLGLVMIIGILLYRQNQVRKKTNASLLHLNRQLDEANKVKAKFFAIISHDFRSPVARLINFLHLQKESPDLLTKEQATEHQQKITASAENLLDNLEDILLWSKSQMENFKPTMKAIAVKDLFERLKNSFALDSGVSFQFKSTEGLTLFTDENFLNTILQNLTSNAVAALKDTLHGKIEWSALIEGKEIILSIMDNGPGLRPSFEDDVLNTTGVSSSTKGFGFHIIRDLANAIQCKITVETIPNKGTTFALHFPTHA